MAPLCWTDVQIDRMVDDRLADIFIRECRCFIVFYRGRVGYRAPWIPDSWYGFPANQALYPARASSVIHIVLIYTYSADRQLRKTNHIGLFLAVLGSLLL